MEELEWAEGGGGAWAGGEEPSTVEAGGRWEYEPAAGEVGEEEAGEEAEAPSPHSAAERKRSRRAPGLALTFLQRGFCPGDSSVITAQPLAITSDLLAFSID